MKKMLKNQKDILNAGMTLGAGVTILGAMGQSTMASKIGTPGANMLGVATTANMGSGIMKMVAKKSKKYSKKKKRF